MVKYTFREALPVWEEGTEKEMNYNIVFRANIARSDKAKVVLSASNMYQMFVGGNLVAEGPARAGHGCYRVDEIDISKYLIKDENIVCIYVDGYYVENFYLIRQPAFLCAEIFADGKIVAATGKSGFEAKYHSERLREVARYSMQRTFTEVYKYDENYRDFETQPDAAFSPVKLVVQEEKKFIERGVPYPRYDECNADKVIVRGSAVFSDKPDKACDIYYITPSATIRTLDRADVVIFDEINKGKYTHTSTKEEKADVVDIAANGYVIYKMPIEKTGFIRFDITASEDTEIIVHFDEVLKDGDVLPERLVTHQRGVVWFLKKGEYSVITNEPYSVNFLKFINRSEGSVTVRNLGITEFAADVEYKPLCSGNENLDLIHKAAVETYRQNTVDIFMDCPSRERAGWLCDSFFTGRTEMLLTGKNEVERNFLENFLISEGWDYVDSRMLPMCYPSDHLDGLFIPNWAKWYILELDEYYKRTGDKELVEMAKERVITLCDYFASFENSDGLIENPDGWVFVDWSEANNYVSGVNYPTNMLYARTLRAVTKLYGDKKYAEKADRIEEVIRKQSYFDGFFHDHAERDENGNLKVVEGHISESCQYYAFFGGTATPETYPELWKKLIEEFTPDREEKGLYPEIDPSNAFIGLYVRLEALSQYGAYDVLMSNIEGFFAPMAKTTGTLWEDKYGAASCNHGFASHVLVWMDKAMNK